MARLFTSGFELNSTTAGVEFTTITGSPTIVSSGQRTGSYCGSLSSVPSGTQYSFNYQFLAADGNGPIYSRVYFYATAWPDGGGSNIIRYLSTGGGNCCSVALTTVGGLQIYDNSGSQIGSDYQLSLNTWYRIEIHADNTLSALDLLVNGTNVASGTGLFTTAFSILAVGANLYTGDTNTLGAWLYDDIAINDSTGSNQTSYPGAGSVLRYKPSAAGDSNTFSVQTGGTAGSANNFTRVDEISPDGATTFNGSKTLSQSDLYKTTGQGGSVNSGSTINCVQVNVYYAGSAASSNSTFKVQAEATSGGTKSQGTATAPNATAYKTNANAVPRLPPLTLYNDPTGSAWTSATIGTMQIGMDITTASTNQANISTVWANVDYIPGAVSSYISELTMLGVG